MIASQRFASRPTALRLASVGPHLHNPTSDSRAVLTSVPCDPQPLGGILEHEAPPYFRTPD
ncbi:hypothetical protein M407DRAFT_246142, partial [Tulasnella calospora MUT 4182]